MDEVFADRVSLVHLCLVMGDQPLAEMRNGIKIITTPDTGPEDNDDHELLDDDHVQQSLDQFLDSINRKSKRSRTWEALVAGVVRDLGGIEKLASAEFELIRRACFLGVLIGDLEEEVLRGKPIDAPVLCTLINTQARTLARLGFTKNTRETTRIVTVNLSPDDHRL